MQSVGSAKGRTTWKRVLIYSISYGAVLIFAALNPRSFLVVIESVTSFSLNMVGKKKHNTKGLNASTIDRNICRLDVGSGKTKKTAQR